MPFIVVIIFRPQASYVDFHTQWELDTAPVDVVAAVTAVEEAPHSSVCFISLAVVWL
jgi:hypothetical protein